MTRSARNKVVRISDAALVRRLADPGDPDLQALIYEAGRRRLLAAAANVGAFLESPEADMRQSALESLGNIGDAEAAPQVLALLDSDPAEVAIRDTAAWVLGLLRYRPAVERLAWLLRDPAPTVRSCSAAALVAIGDRGAFPALRVAEELERDAGVRTDLERAVQELAPKRQIPSAPIPTGVASALNDPARFPFDAQPLSALFP